MSNDSGNGAGENPGSGAGAPRPDATQESLRERSRVIRETREASLRAEGGGVADEQDIDRAAQDGVSGG